MPRISVGMLARCLMKASLLTPPSSSSFQKPASPSSSNPGSTVLETTPSRAAERPTGTPCSDISSAGGGQISNRAREILDIKVSDAKSPSAWGRIGEIHLQAPGTMYRLHLPCLRLCRRKNARPTAKHHLHPEHHRCPSSSALRRKRGDLNQQMTRKRDVLLTWKALIPPRRDTPRATKQRPIARRSSPEIPP